MKMDLQEIQCSIMIILLWQIVWHAVTTTNTINAIWQALYFCKNMSLTINQTLVGCNIATKIRDFVTFETFLVAITFLYFEN